METNVNKNEKNAQIIIWVLSFVVIGLVAFMLFVPNKLNLGFNTKLIPHLNAALNSTTAISLLIGFWAVKTNKIGMHKMMMRFAFVLSSIFLLTYVVYHLTNPSTTFGGEGAIKMVYLIVLLTHILLSIVVLPLVLFSIYYASKGQIERHRKLVKWTFPIWFYVAISGVIVYFMISPYYV